MVAVGIAVVGGKHQIQERFIRSFFIIINELEYMGTGGRCDEKLRYQI